MIRSLNLPSLSLLAFALLDLSCVTLDPFAFNPEKVEEYRWDADPCDPQLEGDFVYVARLRGDEDATCAPSLVPPELRVEGFVDAEGTQIHYVYAHHGDGPRTTVFYSHGNFHNLGAYWDRVEQQWDWGYNVLIYDYPGYGRSEGEPTEQGVYNSARATLELLPGLPGVDLERVFFYGYSLGGAPTYELARQAQRGELPLSPRGIVTEAAWCNMDVMVAEATYIGLGGNYLVSYDFDNCRKIGELDPELPIMIMHGSEDRTVTDTHGRELVKAAATEVEFHHVEGAEHYDIPMTVPDDYQSWMVEFLER